MTAATTVLLIDDDDSVRRAFGRVLTNSGFRVAYAENGERGLQALRSESPSAVLLDLNMPGLGGLDVLTEAVRAAPDTPVIVISGSGIIDNVVQALRRGAWDYVTKPVEDTHLLVQAVRRALDRSTLLRENREQRASLERLNHQLSEALDELRSDQDAGRRIQHHLLPPDGLTIGLYQFRRRLFPSQYLSGDFVDYFALGEDHVALYLADVSGHGAASAFVTAMLSALMGRYKDALSRGQSDVLLHPDRLLQSLNCDLGLRKLKKHVTMFYGVIDLRSQRLCFSSAGQYPFPLFDDGERVHVLECSGRPLGLFEDARFSRREASLEATRRILLLSDGVLELLDEPPGERKVDRLASIMHHAEDMDSLVRAFGIEPARPLRDDVTLLLMERRDRHAP